MIGKAGVIDLNAIVRSVQVASRIQKAYASRVVPKAQNWRANRRRIGLYKMSFCDETEAAGTGTQAEANNARQKQNETAAKLLPPKA